MLYSNYHYNQITKKELISKFYYKSIKNIPFFEKIILTLNLKNLTTKKFLIIPTKLALELITNTYAKETISKKSVLYLKIKKNQIIGCTIVLKNPLQLYLFLNKLIFLIFPKIKGLNKKILKHNNCSLIIKQLLIFPELESYYLIFKELDYLYITFFLNNNKKIQNLVILTSLKFPIS